jgi:protein phosphatase 1 regulatory subunit 7
MSKHHSNDEHVSIDEIVSNDEIVSTLDLSEIPPDADSLEFINYRLSKCPDLSGYPLKVLCFRKNQLTSIKVPSSLIELDLYDNLIVNINGLTCPQLENLDLSFNKIRTIDNLSHLSELSHLYLASNKITAIHNVERLEKLVVLELGANRIARIEHLPPNLTQLWLGKNKITSMLGLHGLDNLVILSLQSNSIARIEGLQSLVNLQELYLSHNNITKLENLVLPKLATLDVSNNQIDKLENLESVPLLEELWVLIYNQG